MKNPEIFWDRVSKNYDTSSKKGTGKPSRPLLATKPYLNIEDSVLDYGCATGKASIEISEFVKNVYGIDISAKMIELAREKVITKNIINVTFDKIEINNVKLKPETFDVIVIYNVLHLLNDLENKIERLHKLLKPGGFFISNTPCLGEQKYIMSTIIYIGSKLNLVPEINMLKGNELEEIISKSDFEIVENRKLTPSDTNNFIVAKKN